MKLVREHINEIKFSDILKPLSQEQILSDIANMSQEEKDKKLLHSVMVNNVTSAEMLISMGANVNKKYHGWDCLLWAAYHGNAEIVKVLLKAPGIDIETRAENGSRTPLIMCAVYKRKRHYDTMKILLDAGANVNAKDRNGNTALDWAKTGELTDIDARLIIELLKQYGAKE